MKKLFLIGVLGAAAAYVLRFVRGGELPAPLYGGAEAGQGEPRPEPNDATLAARVESEVFAAPDAPKGSVDVNAENGIVVLRGEVERPELIDELVEKARSVQGVREVENLLHLPGEEAPMHQAH